MTVPRRPIVPRTAQETVRQAVMALLVAGERSAKEISMTIGIPEKEIYSHLEHIRRSIHSTGGTLEITPAECRTCGFVFSRRERLTSPGRCPVCRSEAIFDPLYSIRLPARDRE